MMTLSLIYLIGLENWSQTVVQSNHHTCTSAYLSS